MRQIDVELKRIIVPLPLNGDFKVPLNQASFFHSKYGAEITVLHVVHETPFLERWFSPARQEKSRKKALEKMKRMVKNRFNDGAILEHIKFKVVTGDIVPSILKVAEKTRADLIIIKKATRLKRGKRFLKQENADRLIANSACPVLTIYKKPAVNGINRILVPVDITKKTDKKVAWAKSMAKRFGAEIHVVSVMNKDIQRVHSFSYQKGCRIEDDLLKDGIKAELVLLEKDGKPMEEVVLDYAREYRPDLLLIMTHQETILFDNYLGSFAREIIHKAKMPVFSVIPQRKTLISDIIDSFAEDAVRRNSGSQPRELKDD